MKIEGNKLAHFQALFEYAERQWAPVVEKLDQYEALYKGTKKVSTVEGGEDKVSYVRNITAELIESQISTVIPPAQVRPFAYNKINHELAKIIEHFLNAIVDRLPFEKLNDKDERITYTSGGSIWLTEWDDTITTHGTRGGIKVSVLDPRNIVPQPAVFEVRDMEYFFVKTTDTYKNIERKYGVDFEDGEATGTNEDNKDSEDTATVITCYYRDDKGLVCKYVWCDNTELEDIEDYWGRKTEKCAICGGTRENCTCKKGVFEASGLEEEPITEDLTFFDGLKVIPSRTPVIDNGIIQTEEEEQVIRNEQGIAQVEDINGMLAEKRQIEKVPETKPTKVPCYKPTLFPIVIRKNISFGDNLLGLSDCDFIRDQQEAINKTESRINEKLLNAGVALYHSKKTKIKLSSEIFNDGIELENLEEKELLGVLDFKPDISSDMVRSDNVYDHAKRTLGISDSYMGQEDNSAESGYAKQIQVQQSAGRLASKRVMKCAAYAELYEIIFQLYLAYADEPRPIAYKDAIEGYKNEEFNRYAFLELDKAGEWYYNDEFLFSTSKSDDAEKNRLSLWQGMTEQLRSGALGNPTDIATLIFYWGVMDSLHYPRANEIKKMLEEKQIKVQEAQAQAQSVIAQANALKQKLANKQAPSPIME